jgi:hypothetical protein
MKIQIDFENLPENSLVIFDYAGLGVVMANPAVIHAGPAQPSSGNKYLVPYYSEWALETFRALFAPSRAQRVALMAGTEEGQGTTLFGILRAFAKDGATEVASSGLKPLTANACATPLAVQTAGADIASVELQMFGFDAQGLPFEPYQAVDDLEFEIPPRPKIRDIRVEPPIYDWAWRIRTLGGLVPPRPWPPGEPWARAFHAARSLAEAAGLADDSVRSAAMESAMRQSELALAAMRREAGEAGKRGKRK